MSKITAFIESLGFRRMVVLLCLIGAVVHVQSLFVGYIADDYDLMEAATSPAFSALRDPFPAGRGTYFRPLVILALRAEHAVAQTAAVHHAVNLIAHLASGVLVLALSLEVCRRRAIAFVAALVFLVHPIVAYNVNWISGRTDGFSTAFSLLALLAFARSVAREEGRSRRMALSVVALVLALAAKEVAACVPIAAGAYAVFTRSRRGAGDRFALRAVALLAGVTGLWIAMLGARFYGDAGAVPSPTLSSLVKAIVAVPLTIVWPSSYRSLRHVMLAFPSSLLVAGVVAAGLVFFAGYLLWRRPTTRTPVLSLVVLASAPLLPLLASGFLPATRLLHFPLATTCIAMAGAVDLVHPSPRMSRGLLLAVPVALVLMVAGSLSRGHRWIENSRRTDAYCESFKALHRDAGGRRPVFVTSPYELDEVPLYMHHVHGALGTCLANGRRFELIEASILGPIILESEPEKVVVEVEHQAGSPLLQVRTTGDTLVWFDLTLTPREPVVLEEGTLVGTDVRHQREVHGISVTLTPDVLAKADLLYFDGLELRRVSK